MQKAIERDRSELTKLLLVTSFPSDSNIKKIVIISKTELYSKTWSLVKAGNTKDNLFNMFVFCEGNCCGQQNKPVIVCFTVISQFYTTCSIQEYCTVIPPHCCV